MLFDEVLLEGLQREKGFGQVHHAVYVYDLYMSVRGKYVLSVYVSVKLVRLYDV